jgi:superfamily II DNA or RNA helicase
MNESQSDVTIRPHGSASIEVRFKSRDRYISKDLFASSRYLDWSTIDFSIPINELPSLVKRILEKHEGWTVSISDELRLYAERELSKERHILDVSTARDAEIPNDTLLLPFRPIQRVAIQFQEYNGYSKICSLATGAGKTPTALGFAERGTNVRSGRKGYRTLWITKASSCEGKRSEIKKFTGKDSIILGGRIPDIHIMNALMSADIQYFLLPYEVIGTEHEQAENDEATFSPWAIMLNTMADGGYLDLCVADEAHLFGNINTKRYKTILQLRIPHRMPMTATPIVNNGRELFPLLKFVAPDTFYSETSFLRTYFHPDGKTVKYEAALQKMLSLYMFRRDFKDIYGDTLPTIERQTITIEVGEPWLSAIKDIEDDIFRKLTTSKNDLDILPALNRLRQYVGKAKLPHTVEYVKGLIAEGRKPLVFFNFQEEAEAAAKMLSCNFIHGGVPQGLRDKYRLEFQSSPQVKVMVVSVKTSQEDFTLTKGTDVVFNDLAWTAKDHIQGEGRCFLRANDLHGGLTTLFSTNTEIDKLITEIISRKMKLMDTSIDGTKEYAEANAGIMRELIQRLRGMR